MYELDHNKNLKIIQPPYPPPPLEEPFLFSQTFHDRNNLKKKHAKFAKNKRNVLGKNDN